MNYIFFLAFVLIAVFSGYGFSANISISEVFYDGTDEWIELYNHGESFHGDLLFSGGRSTILSLTGISLPLGKTLLVGDDFLNVVDKIDYITGQKLSFTDTKDINLCLYSSGELLDQFIVPSLLVNQYNDKLVSFQKVFSGSDINIVPTGLTDIYNVTNGRIANPGYVKIINRSILDQDLQSSELQNSGFNLSGTSELIVDSIDITDDFDGIVSGLNILLYSGGLQVLSGDGFTFSGQDVNSSSGFFDIQSGSGGIIVGGELFITGDQEFLIELGDSSSGDNSIIQNQPESNFYTGYSFIVDGTGFIFSGDNVLNPVIYLYTGLLINEIHPIFDNKYGEYIKVYALNNFSGNIDFFGLGHGKNSKQLNITLLSGNSLFLTNLSGAIFDTNSLYVDGLSLTDDGEKLIMYGQSGLVLDSVEFVGKSSTGSQYFLGASGDTRLFGIPKLVEGSENTQGAPIFNGQVANSIFNNENSFNNGLDAEEIHYCDIGIQKNSNKLLNLISKLDGKEIQNTSKVYTCIWKMPFYGEISKCNPSSMLFEVPGLFEFSLTIYLNGEYLCDYTKDIEILGSVDENNTVKSSKVISKPASKVEKPVKNKIITGSNLAVSGSISSKIIKGSTLSNKKTKLKIKSDVLSGKSQSIEGVDKLKIVKTKNGLCIDYKNSRFGCVKLPQTLSQSQITSINKKLQQSKSKIKSLNKKINDLNSQTKKIKDTYRKQLVGLKGKLAFNSSYIEFINGMISKGSDVVSKSNLIEYVKLYKKNISHDSENYNDFQTLALVDKVAKPLYVASLYTVDIVSGLFIL